MPADGTLHALGIAVASPRRLPLGAAAVVIAVLSALLWLGIWKLAALLF